MADPNWLYSTVVQSSAAMVAIGAGVVTGFVLNRLSEKRTIEARLSDHRMQMRWHADDFHKADRAAFHAEAVWLIDDNLEEIVRTGQLPDWLETYTIVRATDVPRDVFEAAYDELRSDFDLATDVLNVFREEEGPPKDRSVWEAWIPRANCG